MIKKMNSKLLKRMFAAALAISTISIPAFANPTAPQPWDFSIDFTKDYGTGADASDASFSDGKYTLAEINAGKYVQDGTIQTASNPTVTEWNAGGTNPYFTTSNGHLCYENRTNGTTGFKINLPQAVTTGMLVVEFEQAFGFGGTNGSVLRLNDGAELVNRASGSGAVTEKLTGNSGSMNFKPIRLTVARVSESQDWAVKLEWGWNGTVDTGVTGTLSKTTYPSITTVGGSAWRGTGTSDGNAGWKWANVSYTPLTPPSLEKSASLTMTEDPITIFGEVITPTEATYTLNKLEGGVVTGEAIPVEASWSDDGTRLTAVPLKFLEEGASYRLSFTGMAGASGISYDSSLDFTTAAAAVSLSAPIAYTYADVNGDHLVNAEGATTVTAAATVSASSQIGGVLGIYESGSLTKIVPVPFANGSIFTATYTGEALPAGATVKALVFAKTGEDVITIY